MQHTIRDVNAPDGTRLAVHVFTPDADEPKRDVLLLHGWPNAGRVWTDLAEALLLAAPLRVLAPDFRGFGDSDRPESGYSCETFAADALAVAEAFGSKDWALVGHSMGAKIAQLAAAERPVGLTALGLVTPAPLIGAPPGDATARKAAHGDPEKTRELLAPWSARPLSEPAQARVLEDALNTSKAAWDGWLDVMRGEDFAARAAGILVPALVVAGGKDPLRSEDELKRDVADHIRGATFTRLPQCGHLPHLEDPLALAALLVNFFDGLPAGVVATE